MNKNLAERFSWRGWKWIGVLLVPLLIAAAFLAGSWGSGDRLGKVKAAVVNNDQAVTINGQYTPLGRQLAAAMANRKDDNVTWVLTDDKGADEGLKKGEFAAVITIPRNFSAAATSFSNTDADPEQATIDVRTSDSATVNDAALAQQIAGLATQTLNKQLTGTYLDNVYVGFNSMGQQFVSLSTASEQLAKGSAELSKGAAPLAKGTGELDKGMQQLKKGGAELKKGQAALDKAAPQLATGGKQLTDNGPKLTQGAQGLAKGSQQLAEGQAKLSTGVTQYTTGTGQLVDGIGQYAKGVNQLKGQLDNASSGGTTDISGATKPLVEGANGLSKGATQLKTGLNGLESNLNALATNPATGSAMTVAECVTQLQQTQEYCTGYVAGQKVGFTDGWKIGVETAARNVGPMAGGADSLATGAQQLSTGVGQLNSQLAQAQQAGAQQQKQLTAAVGQLANGANTLSQQAQPLKTNGATLASGAKQSVTGAQQLSTGATQLSTGVKQYGEGVTKYATGVKQYSDGVTKLNKGTATYVDGVDKVAKQTPKLAAGTKQLAGGADQLSKGTAQFAKGIKEGQTKVPSYSQQEREQLSSVVSKPVNDPNSGTVGSARIPLTVAVLALGLWLGAVVLNLVRRPVPADALASTTSTARLYLRTMVPGVIFVVIEAAVLALIGTWSMRLTTGRGFVLFGVLAAVGVAFVTINQALAGWLPTVGRVIAIVLATAAVAVSATAAIPGVFEWVNNISPLKPAFAGIRSVVSGESLVSPLGQLIAWTIAAVVMGVLAVNRHRSLNTQRFLALATAREV